MKRVIYLVTYKNVVSPEYNTAKLSIVEDEENGSASDKYEDFISALEQASGLNKTVIIIINSLKFI